ncbi:MAG: hypothetical protein AB7V06_28565 [Candidatus Obscuribacterales bacterium]
MENRKIFQSWISVLEESYDPEATASFHRFMSAWSAFNALYRDHTQVRLPNADGERISVESFDHPDAFGNSHLALLSDRIYERAVLEITQRTPPDPPEWMPKACLSPYVRVWNLDTKYGKKPANQGKCIDETDLKGLLGCLYVIRCNLYHGGKAAGNQFDLTLCESAYLILSALLRSYSWI